MRIKELRKSCKITQSDLGKLLEVNQTAVSQWEKGYTMPHAKKIPYLAHIFDCKIEITSAVSQGK